jgi:acyl-CoA thioesterase
MKTIEEVRKIFEGDRFAMQNGAVIEEIGDHSATCSLVIKDLHRNAMGAVMGGTYFMLADFAFAVLANYLHPMTVTQCGHINYVRAAVTKSITAVAKETVRAGHNTISEVVIYDDKNEVCCVCSFNGFVKDMDKEELKKQYSQK